MVENTREAIENTNPSGSAEQGASRVNTPRGEQPVPPTFPQQPRTQPAAVDRSVFDYSYSTSDYEVRSRQRESEETTTPPESADGKERSLAGGNSPARRAQRDREGRE